jgi:hypothetical protein
MVASVREPSTRSTHAGPQLSSFKEIRPSAQDLTISLERLERLRLSSSPTQIKANSIRDAHGNSVSSSPSILIRRRCKFGLPTLLALENLSGETNFTTPSVPMAPKSGPQIPLSWDFAAHSAQQTPFADSDCEPYLASIDSR